MYAVRRISALHNQINIRMAETKSTVAFDRNDISQSSGTKVDIEGQVAGGEEVPSHKGVEHPGLVTNRSFVPRQWGVYFRAGWGYNVGTIL